MQCHVTQRQINKYLPSTGRHGLKAGRLMAVEKDELRSPSQSSALVHHDHGYLLKEIGLATRHQNPCLFTGITNDDSSPASTQQQVYVCLHIDELVFFLESPTEEEIFKKSSLNGSKSTLWEKPFFPRSDLQLFKKAQQ